MLLQDNRCVHNVTRKRMRSTLKTCSCIYFSFNWRAFTIDTAGNHKWTRGGGPAMHT